MRAATVLVLLLSACDVADSALVNARCDATHGCGAGGLVCDLTTQRCVFPGDGGGDGGAGRDAGADAGTLDAGTLDAGTADAATADAGTADAATADAGADAGTDAGFDAGPPPTTIWTSDFRITDLVVRENEVLWVITAPDGGFTDGGSDSEGTILRLGLPYVPSSFAQLVQSVAFGAKLEAGDRVLACSTPARVRLFNRDGGFISALDKQVSDFDLDAEDAGSEQRIWYTQTEAAVIGYRLVGGGGPTEYGLPICSPTHVVSTLPLGAFVSTDCHLDSASLPLDGGQLLFFARSFSDPMVYAEDLSPTVAIAASPTHVYWATKTGVHRVSRALQPDGGPAAVQAVATGAVDVCGLALDDRSIYWTDKATGRVRQRALDLSTGATDIASSEAGPCAIGVNSTSVLWLDTLDRTIRSRPK